MESRILPAHIVIGNFMINMIKKGMKKLYIKKSKIKYVKYVISHLELIMNLKIIKKLMNAINYMSLNNLKMNAINNNHKIKQLIVLYVVKYVLINKFIFSI